MTPKTRILCAFLLSQWEIKWLMATKKWILNGSSAVTPLVNGKGNFSSSWCWRDLLHHPLFSACFHCKILITRSRSWHLLERVLMVNCFPVITEAKAWWRKREGDYFKMLFFLDLKWGKTTVQMKRLFILWWRINICKISDGFIPVQGKVRSAWISWIICF